MISGLSLLTIVLMGVVTYLTRLSGYMLLRNREVKGRALAVLEAVPGCVFISVIAPAFASEHPADWVALGITILAAMRFSMLPAVLIGIVSTGVLRHFMGSLMGS